MDKESTLKTENLLKHCNTRSHVPPQINHLRSIYKSILVHLQLEMPIKSKVIDKQSHCKCYNDFTLLTCNELLHVKSLKF